MSSAETRVLARRILAVERALLATKQPNLGFSTIADGGAILATDEAENLTMIIGKQFDQTSTAVVVTGPPPPIPTMPFVTSQAGALRIYWDGTFTNSTIAPMDFARVIAYAKPFATLGSPDPLDQTIMVGQFTSATGSEITAALDPDVEYGVFLVCWSQAGKYSTPSDVAISTVGNVVTDADVAAKSSVYRQTTPPWPNGSAGHADDIGDLWYDITGQPGPQISIDTYELGASGVVTLSADGDHGLLVGDNISVVDTGEPLADGTWVVDAVGPSNVLSYLNPAVTFDSGDLPAPDGAIVNGIDTTPLNKPYLWDGTNWVDSSDSGITDAETLINDTIIRVAVGEQAQQITDDQIATLAVTAGDAYQTAITADGRIVISDYEPTDADVEGKVDGSLWITRTRDRQNLCLNPSFEVGVTNWTNNNTTLARVAEAIPGDGAYACQVTNNSTTGVTHGLYTSNAACPTASPSENITASAYARAVSGTTTGAVVVLEFLDASYAVVAGGTFTSTPVDLITAAADTSGAAGWQRLYVTAQAPAGTVYVRTRVRLPAGSESAVWEADAVLIERTARLGRYFDGGSEGCSWDGTSELSTSTMVGSSVIKFFNLEDGSWSERPTATSATPGSARPPWSRPASTSWSPTWPTATRG